MKFFTFLTFLCLTAAELSGQLKNDPGFSETGITLATPTGDISGTLTIPHNLKVSPIVIIIAGSGPTDRDGNNPAGLQTNAYKLLASGFARNSISTLRYDKRGIGMSKSAMKQESDIRFEDYINDVTAWIAMLKSDKRFSKIFVLGHSEGSLIGLAAGNRVNTAGFISVSGAGKSADKILQEQLKSKLPQPLLVESDRILDSLRKGKTVADVNPNLIALYRPSVQPYLISWMKFDPAKEIRSLKIPVMIIQGTTDLQIMVNDARLLADSKPDAKLLIIDGMNHVLKESDSNVQNNMATYKNPDLPLKPGLVDAIADFINSAKQ